MSDLNAALTKWRDVSWWAREPIQDEITVLGGRLASALATALAENDLLRGIWGDYDYTPSVQECQQMFNAMRNREIEAQQALKEIRAIAANPEMELARTAFSIIEKRADAALAVKDT